MSFDKSLLPTDRPVPPNQRTTFIEALRDTVRGTSGLTVELTHGSASGAAVLHVANTQTGHSENIGCDMTEDGWWFVWFGGDTIGPVDDLAGVGRVIVQVLK